MTEYIEIEDIKLEIEGDYEAPQYFEGKHWPASFDISAVFAYHQDILKLLPEVLLTQIENKILEKIKLGR